MKFLKGFIIQKTICGLRLRKGKLELRARKRDRR